MAAPSPRTWALLQLAAWLAAGVHLLAGAAMLLILRAGLDTQELGERLQFLAQHQALWITGWLIWNAAALTILFFYHCLARAHSQTDEVSQAVLNVAVLMSTAGIALDLAAEAIEMGALPELARTAARSAGDPAPTALFLAVHRTAVLMTGYVANGLYSLSALLLAWTTRQAYPLWTWGAGLAAGAFGLGLSAAVLLDSVTGMVATNLFLGPSLLVWLGGVALDAGRRAKLDAAPGV